MDKLVSIIIPSYNRSNIIKETLDSVLSQTYSNWECIIVDDGSTDNTLTIIGGYSLNDSRFKCFSRPNHKPKGPSSCRNYGLENAQGEYVIFLDSDDLLAEFCLEQRVFFSFSYSKFDLWIFKMDVFRENPFEELNLFNNLPDINEPESMFYLHEFSTGRYPFTVTSPLWKKNVLLKLGGFDENLKILEDPDLHLRSFLFGFKSKTANYLKSDCFYRKSVIIDVEKRRKESKILLHKSYYAFLKKHVGNEELDLKEYFNRIFKTHYFPTNSFLYSLKSVFLGYRFNLVSFNKFLILCLIILYRFLGIKRLKDIVLSVFKKAN